MALVSGKVFVWSFLCSMAVCFAVTWPEVWGAAVFWAFAALNAIAEASGDSK